MEVWPRGLPVGEISRVVRERGWYRQRAGGVLSDQQTWARVHNYEHLFVIDRSTSPMTVRLRDRSSISAPSVVASAGGSRQAAKSVLTHKGRAVGGVGHLNLLGTCLDELLRRSVLQVALRQRAKFEGWLKVELAHALEQRGVRAELEASVGGTSHRADIKIRSPGGEQFLIVLKTVNTNFRFPGVVERTRPITKNISGVIEDATKVRAASPLITGLLVFPVFPVASDEGHRVRQLAEHVKRIEQAGCRVELQGFVSPAGSDGSWGVSWFVMSV